MPAGSSDEAKFAALVEFFRAKLNDGHAPGGAIAVVLNGHLAFEAGIGVRREGRADPVTATTLFRVGSTSKLITAIAAMSLVESGRLDLDRPIAEGAAWFTRRAGDDVAGVTIRRALTHTAGIPEEGTWSCSTPDGWRLRSYFVDRARDPLWAPPGSVFNYSNSGYDLVGAVIEDASEMSYAEFVRASVFVPAGMAHATFDVPAFRAADHAVGHTADGHPSERSDTDACKWLEPAGGVIASVDDFAHLMETLLAGGGAMLTRASVDAIEAEQTVTQRRPGESYGLGLFTSNDNGLRVVGHGGNVPGYASFMLMVPERGFGVVAMINSEGHVVNPASAAVELFLDRPAAPPPAGRHTPPSSWSEYAGRYEDTAGQLGTFDVKLRGDELVMTRLVGESSPINGGVAGAFWRDAQGRVTHFVTRAGVAKRVE